MDAWELNRSHPSDLAGENLHDFRDVPLRAWMDLRKDSPVLPESYAENRDIVETRVASTKAERDLPRSFSKAIERTCVQNPCFECCAADTDRLNMRHQDVILCWLAEKGATVEKRGHHESRPVLTAHSKRLDFTEMIEVGRLQDIDMPCLHFHGLAKQIGCVGGELEILGIVHSQTTEKASRTRSAIIDILVTHCVVVTGFAKPVFCRPRLMHRTDSLHVIISQEPRGIVTQSRQ